MSDKLDGRKPARAGSWICVQCGIGSGSMWLGQHPNGDEAPTCCNGKRMQSYAFYSENPVTVEDMVKRGMDPRKVML